MEARIIKVEENPVKDWLTVTVVVGAMKPQYEPMPERLALADDAVLDDDEKKEKEWISYQNQLEKEKYWEDLEQVFMLHIGPVIIRQD